MQTDIDGETPLHYAARHGRTAVAELLLSYGAKAVLEYKPNILIRLSRFIKR